jgi:hypothetical protein
LEKGSTDAKFLKEKKSWQEVAFFGNLEEMTVGTTDTARIGTNEYSLRFKI